MTFWVVIQNAAMECTRLQDIYKDSYNIHRPVHTPHKAKYHGWFDWLFQEFEITSWYEMIELVDG